MTLFQRLEQLAQLHPEKTAIKAPDGETSYANLFQQSQRYAHYFQQACKLKPGDRIAILSENTPAFFAVLFAASEIGTIVTPFNWRLSLEELQYATADAEPSILIHSECYSSQTEILNQSATFRKVSWQSLHEQSAKADITTSQRPKLSDDILLVYTSGTTGRPKGAVLNQQALLASAKMSRDAFSLNAKDQILCSLPLFHVGGLNIQALPGLLEGATVHLQAVFDPQGAIEIIRQQHISQYLAVPTMIAALLKQEQWNEVASSNLRCLGTGSMDVPLKQIQQIHDIGVPVVQIYGATETGPVAIHQTTDNAMASSGSIGIASSECQVRLIDEQSNDVPKGTPGEIALKGENIFSYYWNNLDATKASKADGWYRTGDVARQDAEGYYWFTDRLKNVIISGGENIYAAEVERVLMTAADVSEVAVVGLPDETWGETVAAVIVSVPNQSISAATLAAHCEQTLARFKLPRSYFQLEALPKNALGKVQYDTLKTRIVAEPNKRLH